MATVPPPRALSPDDTELLRRRQAVFPSCLSLSYVPPLHMVRGAGSKLYDSAGVEYLDCVNNVACVGHAHPAVAAAGASQLATLNTNSRYLSHVTTEFAEALLKRCPAPLDTVFITCSGSEANEVALRLARAHTGRHDVVVVGSAYHGNTSSLVDMSPYKFEGRGVFPKKDYVHVVPSPDVYRGRHRGRQDDAALGAAYAQDVADTVAAMSAADRPVAAFFCESVLGCAGQVVLPAGYFAAAAAAVRAAGGVVVADEVQVGYGRVGASFWAFEGQGLVPDIVTAGKPMGNGFALAACITTRAIAEALSPMEYFNTFGGSTAACAVGLAVLKAIDDEDLQGNAGRVGDFLLHELRAVQDKYPHVVGDVRGVGLFVGVELVEDAATRAPATALAREVANRMACRRVLVSTDGPHANVLKMKPPLCFSMADARRLVCELDGVLAECSVRPPTPRL